jgi:tetratricopeptide (TPR) repeat protein
MSKKETLLYRLIELMLEKQQTFLLLDKLYEDEVISPFVRNIQIDSPYQQLLLEGLLSQLSQGEEIVVSVTVENYFHHLLGHILQKDNRYQSSESLIQLVKSNNLKGLKEGVSNLLSFDIEKENFTRITKLIDLSEGDEDVLEMSVMPLVNSLIIHGAQKTIDVILENTTDNDWEVLLKIDSRLFQLDLHILRKAFLEILAPLNPMFSNNEVLLGIFCCRELNKEIALNLLEKIRLKTTLINLDSDVLFNLGQLEDDYGNYQIALNYFEKCLEIDKNTLGNHHPDISTIYNNIASVLRKTDDLDRSLKLSLNSLDVLLKNFGEFNSSVATCYNNIGLILCDLGEFDEALDNLSKSLEIYSKTNGKVNMYVASAYNNIGNILCHKGDINKALENSFKSLSISLKIFGSDHIKIATSYINIGILHLYKEDYDKALEFSHNALSIYLEKHEEFQPDVATIYNNIGAIYKYKKDLDKSLLYYKKCLKIRIKVYGKEHSMVAQSYKNIGTLFYDKRNYNKTMFYYQKSLKILLFKLGEKHPEVVQTYYNMGLCLVKSNEYFFAIKKFQSAFKISNNSAFLIKIAKCYEALIDKENALDYYIQSAEIRKEDVGINEDAFQDTIMNVKRLAKELGKEEELPEWIK